MNTKTFSLDELCSLTGHYIQLGLVSRPVGEARAAKYTCERLGRLLRIKDLSAAGVSLERIREVLASGSLRFRRAGPSQARWRCAATSMPRRALKSRLCRKKRT